MTSRSYRAGDTVFVPALSEEWLLACDEHEGMVTCCGWPEARVKASEVELRHAADDAARLQMLSTVAKTEGARGSLARRQVAAEAEVAVGAPLPSFDPDADQDAFNRVALAPVVFDPEEETRG